MSLGRIAANTSYLINLSHFPIFINPNTFTGVVLQIRYAVQSTPTWDLRQRYDNDLKHECSVVHMSKPTKQGVDGDRAVTACFPISMFVIDIK